MIATATAIYEKGTLRLLTPVSLPERARVRVQIQEEEKTADDVQRATAVLEASSLVKRSVQPDAIGVVPPARRAELAQIYAAAGPLSELIIAERDGR